MIGGGAVNALGVVVRAVSGDFQLFSDRVATLDSNGTTFNVDVPRTNFQRVEGHLVVQVLPDSLATATINQIGGIDSDDTTIPIDGVTGTIPASGWCRIGSEWMSYTYSSPNLTVIRGLFNSTQAAHADDAAIKFSAYKESASPFYKWSIRGDSDLW